MRTWLPVQLGQLAAAGWELEGELLIAVEQEWAEGHYAVEPEGEPDTVFQRRWTLTVLEFAMQALRAEYATRGWEELFAEVAPFVGFEDGGEARYAAAAERAGMTVGALKRAVFDFRTHHREVLRSIVADTVADPADVSGEITALLCACDLPTGPDAPSAPLPTSIRSFKPDELLARAMNTVHMTSGGTGKWQPPSDAEAAGLFPQFEMLGMIGRGGMGAVYRARQVALDREVAIKLLPLEVSADQAFAGRFVREARAMAKLSHPNIIPVFGFGTTAEGHLYFFMEYVEGANLSQLIRAPGLVPEQALAITAQVCGALAYAHGRGVIHRDIKSANVMVGSDGVVKVADFGLARVEGADPSEYGQTMTGTIMGTAEYMAPEQKRGMDVDHRADIYSVGVVLYEMLCRELPQGAFEPPSQRAGCDVRIDQIVLKAMHRLPESRYQSATEMQGDLELLRTPLPDALPIEQPRTPPGDRGFTPQREKSRSGALAALVVAALLIAGSLYFLNDDANSLAKKSAELTDEPFPSPSTPPSASPPAIEPVVPSATPVPVEPIKPVPPSAPAMATPAQPMKPEPASPQQVVSGPNVAGPTSPLAPINLLATADATQGALKGDWQTTPEGLVLKNDTSDSSQVFAFDFIPPEEYDFEIEFTIQDGLREACQIFPIAGRSILWKMGFGSGEFTPFSFGPLLDGGLPTARGRSEAVIPRPRLKQDQRYRSVVEVRRGSVRALLDGQEVLRWNGDFQRLDNEEPFRLTNPRNVGVGSWASGIHFHKAEIRPHRAIDLLADVNVERDAVHGAWTKTAAGLAVTTAGGREHLLLGLNFVPPEQYDFEIEFTIQGGVHEVSQALPLGGQTVMWKMGCFAKAQRAYFALGHALDGEPPPSKVRTEAAVSLPLLHANQRYRCVAEVRRDSFRAVLDGREVLRWSGDFHRFGEEAKMQLPNPAQLGIGAWSTSVLFHKAEVRSPGMSTRRPTSTVPAASELVAASNDPRLVKLEAAFRARFESDAQKPYLASVAALNQSYLANGLTRARAAAQVKGSLAEVTALEDEKAAIERNEGVPATDVDPTPEALKSLRATYRAAMNKYTAERARSGAQIYDLYLASLKTYEAELTRADKIDEAKKVRAVSEDVAAQKTELMRPAEDSSKATVVTAPASPAPGAGAPFSNPAKAREAAKWLLAGGGMCTVATTAGETEVRTEAELPAEGFALVGFSINRENWKSADPKESDMRVFRGIKTLRKVNAYTPNLGDAAFSFLAENPELTSVQILTDFHLVSDRVLQSVESARQITDFMVRYTTNFTGKGLEKMPWLPRLTKADFFGSGIGNRGLEELLGATQLTELNLGSCKSVTDAGLAKLTALTKLQKLDLRGTAVTRNGVEAFKKARPNCDVTQ